MQSYIQVYVHLFTRDYLMFPDCHSLLTLFPKLICSRVHLCMGIVVSAVDELVHRAVGRAIEADLRASNWGTATCYAWRTVAKVRKKLLIFFFFSTGIY